MTKDELLQAIAIKVDHANPMVKEVFLRGLKYKTKRELEQLLEKAKVDEDGYGIEL